MVDYIKKCPRHEEPDFPLELGGRVICGTCLVRSLDAHAISDLTPPPDPIDWPMDKNAMQQPTPSEMSQLAAEGSCSQGGWAEAKLAEGGAQTLAAIGENKLAGDEQKKNPGGENNPGSSEQPKQTQE